MSDKKRLLWIDALRGFAIFIIVLGHTIGYSKNLVGLGKYLSSFYVPLFFLVSGYLYKNKKDEKFLTFAKKKAKRVLIPYFVFASLSLIPFYLFGGSVNEVLNTKRTSKGNIFISLLYVLYGSGHIGGLHQNSPLWFLPCYFMVTILGKIAADLINKTKIKKKNIVLAFVFLILGFIIYKFFNYAYPFSIESSLIMLYFYFLGSSLRNVKINSRKIIFLISLLFLTAGCILQLYNGRISCMNNDYSNSFLIFILSATLSTIGYKCLFESLFNKSKILSFLGIHTIPILVFHKMPLVVFQSKIKFISSILKNGSVIESLIMAILVATTVIIISIIVYKIVIRFLPIVYGENKKVGQE